ncbi:MAG TPA: hypothetical protein VJQ43_04205 [Thermoplasmata archaeon]|nr:hypothetical protein [Thermoplasmata archaeon]
MGTYRASDEALEREIAAVERIVQVRLRRYASEMRDLDRDLSELRKERARRRAANEVAADATRASVEA